MSDDDSQQVNQDEIEELLRQAQAGPPPGAAGSSGGGAPLASDELSSLLTSGGGAPPTAAPPESEPPPVRDGDDVHMLLAHSEQALASVDAPSDSTPLGAQAFDLPHLKGTPANTENATLELLRDVELDVRIELGRTNMELAEVLKLKRGSVVPLDKLAGDPVDVFVNGRLVARGEILVLNDNFCVRVNALVAGDDGE